MLALLANLACTGLAATPAGARDIVVTSFDGTAIAASFYPAATVPAGEPAPTILRTHGFGRRRDREATPHGPVDHYVRAGYNVLTWDSRGFGESGGTSMLNDPAYEGADVRTLLDFVAAQPEALLDAPGDPRAGMTGGSYAGDIQLVAAALDARIDAIAPAYAWSSLLDSLHPRGALKSGWYDALAALASPPDGGSVDPRFVGFWQQATLGGGVSQANHDFLATRSRTALVETIRAPTLLRAGTPDTLFTLSQAIASYTILRDRGVPVKMVWDCAGHGDCLAGEGDDRSHAADAEDAWLARWLKRDLGTVVGPGFEWIADDRVWRSSPGWPVGPGGELVATGAAVMEIVPGHGPGPSPAHVWIPPPPTDTELAGAPVLELTYGGTASVADTWVYALIADERTNLVLGNQATPIPVKLDGAVHTVSVPLEVVAAHLTPGSRYVFEIASGTSLYAPQRASGQIAMTSIRIRLPVSDPMPAPAASPAIAAAATTLPTRDRNPLSAIQALVGQRLSANGRTTRSPLQLRARAARIASAKVPWCKRSVRRRSSRDAKSSRHPKFSRATKLSRCQRSGRSRRR